MAEATAQLGILVKVKDEASAALRRLSDDVSDLGGSLGFAGAKGGILAGAIAAVAGATLFKATQSFAQAEVTMARFDAIMATLPPSLQKYKTTLLLAADEALKFGFDNETAAVSLARLLQATGDINVTMLAFQAAMDLARFKGIGLEEATRAIILAFQGNTRMLKEFGIEVDEHASKQTILAAIIKATQGQAELYASTMQGLTDIFKVYVGEVNEALGQPFAEWIKGVLEPLSDWIEAQGGINVLIQGYRSFIEAAGLALLILFIPAVIKAGAMVLGFLGFLSPAGLAIMGLATAVAALKLAWDSNWLGIRDITGTVVDWIVDKLKSLMDFIQKMMDLLGALIRQVKKLLREGGSIIGGIKGAITPFQEGGIVTRPTLGLLGEAGPEAIVPLNRLAGAGIGGNITINLSGDFFTDTETAERWANEIARIIKFQLKL